MDAPAGSAARNPRAARTPTTSAEPAGPGDAMPVLDPNSHMLFGLIWDGKRDWFLKRRLRTKYLKRYRNIRLNLFNKPVT